MGGIGGEIGLLLGVEGRGGGVKQFSRLYG